MKDLIKWKVICAGGLYETYFYVDANTETEAESLGETEFLRAFDEYPTDVTAIRVEGE